MKIRCLLVAMALFCGQSIANQEITPLLPEVKKLLEVPDIDESTMDQNAYVSLMAIDAADDNYQEIGKKIILAEHNQLQEALKTQDIQLYMESLPNNYKQLDKLYISETKHFGFHCIKLEIPQCFSELLKNPSILDEFTTKNATLLARYEKLIKLPNYQGYTFTLSSSLPNFPAYLLASRIRLAKAVIYINQGDIKAGLTVIEEELSFVKLILNTEPTLIENMIAIKQLLTIYHTISELLDTQALANQLQNPQLLTLLKPLTDKEQQAIATTMQLEISFIIKYIQIESKWNVLKNFFRDPQQYKLYKEAISKNLAVTYNKNKTMNLIYKEFASLSSIATIVLPEASTIYLTLSQDKSELLLTLDEIIEKYGADNLIGNIILESPINVRYNKYLYRFYDISNYLALVTAKLKIKQAGITKEQVPSFLTKLGDKAINPYSKKPFIWDEKQQALSSDWLYNDSEERATIYIKF